MSQEKDETGQEKRWQSWARSYYAGLVGLAKGLGLYLRLVESF